MRVRALVVLCAALVLPALARPAQDSDGPSPKSSTPDDEVPAKIEKYFGLARTGHMAVRPQAARRLVGLGAPAARRLLQECGDRGEKMAALGQYLVEVLGDFEHPRLRVLLWQNLRDLDFPWRGAAARSLAGTAAASESGAFWSLLRDHLAPVRVAAVEALGSLCEGSAEQRQSLIAQLLREPNDRVRRAEAALLDDWGESGYLIWLVEDLKRTDAYFRLPFGEQARYQSARLLKKRLGQLYGFSPEGSPEEEANLRAIGQISEAIRERAGGSLPELPTIALAGRSTPGNSIGLELRSCRLGEYYLRWNRADVLQVGTSRPLEIPLAEGTVARLEAALGECLSALADERYWGDAGCDIEQLRLVGEDGKLDNFLVSKGQGTIPDLRPDTLDRAVRLLLESIPLTPPSESAGTGAERGSKAGDVRGERLRQRVEAALHAIGGEF